MKKNSHQLIHHQTAKTVLITSAVLALLLPPSLVAADTKSDTIKPTTEVSAQASATTKTSEADPTKVKFTQEQAVAKIKELFPSLKEATASNIQLGSTQSFPAPTNQMIWNIQWQIQEGNTSYGFNTEVDAITGDIINTYIPISRGNNESYYPPKVTKAQALEIARAFTVKAASSIKSSDLQLEENANYNYSATSLFGPIQYNFYFNILKNGITTSNNINVAIDGNGQVMQFSKTSQELIYPPAQPKISLAQAEQIVADQFDVGLYYIPIYKNGRVNSWMLGWRPAEQSLYPIDAITGKKIDFQAKEQSSTPVVYSDVTKSKNVFQPRNSNTELSAKEAAQLVKKLAYIPADRELLYQSMRNDHQDTDRKIWSLSWGPSGAERYGSQEQTSAEIDAKTGELLQFQVQTYSYLGTKKEEPAPVGGKKLNLTEAKAKAVSLINSLYPNASEKLKLIEYGNNSNVHVDGSGYSYQFIRFHQGIPVSDSTVTVSIDLYGRLQSYMGNRINGIDSITQSPDATITKKEALDRYKTKYQTKLKYTDFGGYNINNFYTDVKVKLVYDTTSVDPNGLYQVLDAVTGKWMTIYDYFGQQGVQIPATDIKGHPVEQQLAELIKYNVLTVEADGKVNPDQEISIGDWLTYLSKASNPYFSNYYINNERNTVLGVKPENPYYDAVYFAVDRKWISRDGNLQIEGKLTKEQLAVQLSSILKYNKLIAYLGEDEVVTQFSDNSSISNKGAVALVVKLGLLEGDNGKFNPQQKVTKGLAASVIMKLVELQGKTDQIIGQ